VAMIVVSSDDSRTAMMSALKSSTSCRWLKPGTVDARDVGPTIRPPRASGRRGAHRVVAQPSNSRLGSLCRGAKGSPMIRTTPFHERLAPLNATGLWTHWSGYLVSVKYQMAQKAEYFAVRNAVGLIDTSPLFKYRITGPD